ncbi:uncharacterized protein LOC120084839 [Benincasa hispida]|uniref:uncharacterized protein LOC120084839 n=1 Tax=Benincasa hispida TaxID=102211 RepID=UPI0018FFDBC0|nr:uncharacterized protein LOC120084839 [Benincasa hispida]
MCSAFTILGVTLKGLRLYLFPYTLRDEAKRWAQSLEPDEINAWDQLVERQLVKSCPHIGILDCILMETFYNGLDQLTQAVVDASATRGLMDRPYMEAKSILDRISQNLDECTSSLETLLKHYIEKSEAIRQSQASSLRELEEQVKQLAIELKNKTPVPVPPVPESITRPVDLTTDDYQSTTNDKITSSEVSTSTRDESRQDLNSKSTQPPVIKTQQAQDLNEQPAAQEVRRDPPSFPSRLKKKDDSKQFQRFLDVLRQLHINIPLIEDLEQMSSYVKFLKDIFANKRKIGENEIVALTYECSALFQNNIPTKMKDPGSFTFPCSIGGKKVRNALGDLGASINLMPLSIFKKLNIDNARPTTITLQLVDRSITHPEGKIEDVLVQVDKFIFPADFIILDYEADREVPITLGRPFLTTGRALIDV